MTEPQESPPQKPSERREQLDHPIFQESVRRIRGWLEPTGVYQGLSPLEQELVERLVHSSGDLELAPQVAWTPQACSLGGQALAEGAVILTDTAMAAAAVAPMAPPAPGRVTTTVPDFQTLFIAWPNSRLGWSAAPPGGKGTMMLTGLFGKLACAQAVAPMNKPQSIQIRRHDMDCLQSVC